MSVVIFRATSGFRCEHAAKTRSESESRGSEDENEDEWMMARHQESLVAAWFMQGGALVQEEVELDDLTSLPWHLEGGAEDVSGATASGASTRQLEVQ